MTDLFLFEKRSHLAEAQSGRNSGVVHAGIYYPSDSLKARLCVDANALMYEFCRAHDVPIANVGKLVVACTKQEETELAAIFAQAQANAVPGVKMLTSTQVRALEKNVHVSAAMHVPSTGVMDAAGVTNKLAREAGATVLTGFEIEAIKACRGAPFRLHGRQGAEAQAFEAELVVNAAGLYSDAVARMVNPQFQPRIAPLRGEYFTFSRRRRPELWLEQMNVYPVPEWLDVDGERQRMVGVHLTPTFAMQRDGSVGLGPVVTVGPEFSRVQHQEDYEDSRKGAELFLARAQRFFPGLRLDDLELGFAGIMASLTEGSDFIIERDAVHPDCVQLVGIDSPGMTCCLAIAKRVASLLR